MVCQRALEVAQTIFIPIGWRARVQGQANTTDTTAMVALGGGCATSTNTHFQPGSPTPSKKLVFECAQALKHVLILYGESD